MHFKLLEPGRAAHGSTPMFEAAAIINVMDAIPGRVVLFLVQDFEEIERTRNIINRHLLYDWTKRELKRARQNSHQNCCQNPEHAKKENLSGSAQSPTSTKIYPDSRTNLGQNIENFIRIKWYLGPKIQKFIREMHTPLR